MTGELLDYQQFIENCEKYELSETLTNIIVMGNAKSTQLVDLARNVLDLDSKSGSFIGSFRFTILLDEEDIEIELMLDQSHSSVKFGNASPEDLAGVSQFGNIPTLDIIYQICSVGLHIKPEELLEIVENDSTNLDKLDFVWNFSLELFKDPIIEILRKLHTNIQSDQPICIFSSVERLITFLILNQGLDLHQLALDSRGSCVVFVGNFDATISGNYLIFSELWKSHKDLDDAVEHLNDAGVLRLEHVLLKKWTYSKNIPITLVPTFFEISSSTSIVSIQKLTNFLVHLQTLYSLLILCTNASKSESGSWTMRIVGSRTIQSDVSLDGDNITIDGTTLKDSFQEFIELVRWILLDKSSAKLSIVQKTATLHSANLVEMLASSQFILRSSEAAHELYVQEMVSDVMEVRQRFSEYLLDWSSKDIDSRMKLDDALNLTAIGGLSTIIASTISLALQSFNQIAVKTAWLVVPPLITIYVLIMLIRIVLTNRIFSTYMNEHLRQVKFYEGILGKLVVQHIAGKTSKDELKHDFVRTRNWYIGILVILMASIIIFWCLFVPPILIGLDVEI